MNLLRSRLGFAAILMSGATIGSTAWGAEQVLDRVVAVGAAATSQMSFEIPPDERNTPDFKPSVPYFTTPTSTSKGFTACQATIRGGVICIDEGAGDIREWTTPAKDAPPDHLFTCAELGFTGKGGASGCSGLALQPDAIWVAGRKSGNLYSLVKVVPLKKGGSCETNSAPVGDKYCKISQDYATGRPLLQELNALDVELADEYEFNAGVYGVELRSTILFYKDTPTSEPEVIGTKKDLGLAGNEQVLSAALTRFGNEFVYLYVTDRGRVLAFNRHRNVPVEVFNISSQASRNGWTACASGDDFGLTVSKFGRIYASDRSYCRVLALEMTSNDLDASQSTNYGFKLQVVDALSTSPMGPESVSVAPGVVLNLADCADECTFVSSEDGRAGAKMSGIQLQDTGSTYMTVYKVEGIPDCRYIPASDACKDKNSVVAGEDGWRWLDVSKLLPKEITDLFPDGLPPMLISPQWHADPGPLKNYEFDALFGIRESGLEFKGVGSLELYVDRLTGDQRGCPESPDFEPALDFGSYIPAATLIDNWDVTTTVSERSVSSSNRMVGNLDTIMNLGCGSTKGAAIEWSLKPVDLVMNRTTVHRNIYDMTDLKPDGTPVLYRTENDDAVFAKLVDALYDDLRLMLDEQACKAVDGNILDRAPLTESVCSSLRSVWSNGRDKLDKCLSATAQPKQSAGDQNCSAFGSQLNNFIATAQSVMPAAQGGDPANRIGEVQGRAEIIEYLLYFRFLPSIKPEGFCEDPDANCGMTEVSPSYPLPRH